MAEIDTNGFVAELEQTNQLKRGTLRAKGFRPFLNRTLTDLEPRDRQIVFDAVQFYLGKSIEISRERYFRRQERNGFGSRRVRSRGPVVYKRDVEQALLFARRDLLAPESGLSSKARDFIKDHCPCA